MFLLTVKQLKKSGYSQKNATSSVTHQLIMSNKYNKTLKNCTSARTRCLQLLTKVFVSMNSVNIRSVKSRQEEEIQYVVTVCGDMGCCLRNEALRSI